MAKTRTCYYQKPLYNPPLPLPSAQLNVLDSKNESTLECFCPSLGGCKYLTTVSSGREHNIFKSPLDNKKSILLLDRFKYFRQTLLMSQICKKA